MVISLIIVALLFFLALIYSISLWKKLADARSAESVAMTKLENEYQESFRLKADLEQLQSHRREQENNISLLRENLIRAESEIEHLKSHLESVSLEHKRQMDESAKQNAELMQRTEAHFKLMASDIMKKQSESLRDESEQRIGEILRPLKENIERFRNEVNQCYTAESRERFSLQERIKELIEANNNIGREAKELSLALRGNSKKQGDWGELVLETILENSGLRKNEEYFVQLTTDDSGAILRDEHGRGLRPDVVVRCPDGKSMVIDSKVSLTAFVDYVNTEDATEQERFGKLHVASVLDHISRLSEKNYQDYIGDEKLDFVMMFVPNEAAYSAAMTLEPTIWQKAYDKRVLLVSPTQLIGTLRLINQLWTQDRQTRNAIEIAEKSGQMYDKFVGFVADMEKIEKGINATRAAYDGAINKLRDGRGNLINRVESLRQLGIKASKRLPKSRVGENEDSDDSDDSDGI